MGDPTWLPPLAIALPVLTAAVVRLPGIAERRVADVIAAVTSAVVAGGAVWLLPHAAATPVVHHLGGWAPRDGAVLGIPLVADGLAVGVVAVAATLLAAAHVHLAVSAERRAQTTVLTALLLGATAGFVLAGDLLTMFVFLELFGVTVYAVTAGRAEDPAATPAAIHLAVVSTLGAVLFLAGAGLLYRLGGAPTLVALGGAEVTREGSGAVAAAAIALLSGGLAVKAGLVPFHFAHVDVHTANWSPHAGYLGAIMLPLALVGLLRLHVTVVGDHQVLASLLRTTLVTVGTITALVGAVLSLLQDHLKRLLAFSSIAHLGIVAVGLGLRTAEGVAAAALYVAGHAPVKLAMLLLAGTLLYRCGSLQLSDLAGHGRRFPGTVAVLAVGGLVLAGAPPSGTYVGEAVLSDALTSGGGGALRWPLYLAAGLTGAAVLRVVGHLWTGRAVPADPLGEVPEHHPTPDPDARGATATVVTAASLTGLAIVVPLVPGALDVAAQLGATAVDAAVQRAAVLGDPLPGSVVPALDPWGASSVWTATGVVAAATVSAGAMVGWWRRTPRAVTRPLRALRAAHTGVVADQVTWLLAGVAAWAVTVHLALR